MNRSSVDQQRARSSGPESGPLWISMHSDRPLPQLPDAPAHSEATVPAAKDEEPTFWLDGNAIMCACPDCAAPMSVRLWLLIADCWRCGTSIEITEEQEAEIRQLLHQYSQTEAAGPATAAAPAARLAPATSTEPVVVIEAPHQTRPEVEANQGSQSQASPQTAPATTRRRSRAWLEGLLRDTPAWLVSLIVHLIILTILALLKFEQEKRPLQLILSATIGSALREGGDNVFASPQDETHFDLPLPEDVDLTSDREKKAMVVAAQDAKELQIDPDSPTPQLPDVKEVKQRLGETNDIRAALAARDPRIRVEMVRSEGGTTLTEASVARGLRWLAQRQLDDGSWTLRGHDGGGGVESRASATGMALLAFLGAGQTHLVGRYQGEVSRGLRWLIEHQGADGDLRAGSDHQAGMYAHGQAAIALCEAFGLTGDEKLREPAEKAIRFIAAAQYSDGGWRYSPEEPINPPGGDTSVVGWQLMALQSARAARLEMPEFTLELAGQFLDRVQHDGGATYSYRPEERPTATMTAEALLCRMYLGWDREMPGVRDGVRTLVQEHLPDEGNWNIYYWYYGTQVLHHYGQDEWETWNKRMRDLLVYAQEVQGPNAGSWAPRGPFGDQGGRLYMTALSVCTLEVYYRHLPLFRPLELE